MRIANIENYKNNQLIERRKINSVPPIGRSYIILSDKDKIKFIKMVESIVRSSMEYKDYIKFLRDEIDMTCCSYFNNIQKKDKGKVTIEIHHEPFTLFDIVLIVTEKWIQEGKELNPLLISEEVMKIHYQGNVGLIPLSKTVHKLLHLGKLFIPLQCVYGNFIQFLEEYEIYINDDLKSILEYKLTLSKDIESNDMSILEKKYIYLEIDGMSFPQPLEEKVKK